LAALTVWKNGNLDSVLSLFLTFELAEFESSEGEAFLELTSKSQFFSAGIDDRINNSDCSLSILLSYASMEPATRCFWQNWSLTMSQISLSIVVKHKTRSSVDKLLNLELHDQKLLKPKLVKIMYEF
jgi:hypothetical protein